MAFVADAIRADGITFIICIQQKKKKTSYKAMPNGRKLIAPV